MRREAERGKGGDVYRGIQKRVDFGIHNRGKVLCNFPKPLPIASS